MRKAFSLFLFVISAIKKIVTATAEGGGFNDENPLEGSTVILGLTFFPNIKVIFCVRKVTFILRRSMAATLQPPHPRHLGLGASAER